MNYAFVIMLLSFYGAVHLTIKFGIRPFYSALIATGIPYAVSQITQAIILNNYDALSWQSLFTVENIVTFAAQLTLAYVLFRKIESEEGIVASFFWALGGFFVIAMAIPFVVQQLI